jgi:hypothetical protein
LFPGQNGRKPKYKVQKTLMPHKVIHKRQIEAFTICQALFASI